ncbi:MAG: Na+/H+ antiporter [Actinomycetales bacterium]|nr:Na+/H+ antiporter [Actinomycetales bacterium]
MEIATLFVGLAVVVLAGTALSDRLRFPAPLVLIAVGVAASFVPAVPAVELHPEVVLIGLLPPLLYAASLQTSLVDFNANRWPILLLSVGLVVATTAAVAVGVYLLLPGLGWPAAVAIGAVVAPPDAVAATAIARRIGLPRRVVTILEGESLLNDATALVALRTAIAASAGGVAAVEIGLDFLRAAVGGALVGVVVFLVVVKLRKRIHDPLLDTGISFVTPFAAYLPAESIHASGVIAVVVAGLLLGHKAPIVQTARSRITERITWATVAFLLENSVFLLIGLQARRLINDVLDGDVGVLRALVVCALTLVVVVLVRLGWVFASRALLITGRREARLSAAATFLVGWAGMRGVVTLAAAFVIPADTPHRSVLLLVAFTTVAGTLFLQGLTLPWLTRRLGVPGPDPAADALARATLLQQAATAGITRLEELEADDQHGVADLVRGRAEQRTFAAWERLGTRQEAETPSELYARLRGAMIDAERSRVLEIRAGGQVPADVVREVLGLLDIEESMIDAGTEQRASIHSGGPALVGSGGCEDLDAFPTRHTEVDPVCRQCVADGTTWVALRICLACGEVSCCDSSIGRHATAHFQNTQHPVMQSAEPGEAWRWCYIHHATG